MFWLDIFNKKSKNRKQNCGALGGTGGSPKDFLFPWGLWDCGVPGVTGEVPRTSSAPLGTLEWEGQWDSPLIPQWHYGAPNGQWDFLKTSQSPLRPRDVQTGHRSSVGKPGYHSFWTQTNLILKVVRHLKVIGAKFDLTLHVWVVHTYTTCTCKHTQTHIHNSYLVISPRVRDD